MEPPDIDDALKALRENPNFHAVLQDLRSQFLSEVDALNGCDLDEVLSRRGVIASLRNQYEYYSGTTILGDPL